MYQEFRRVADGLIRFEAKIGEKLDALANANGEVDGRLDDHEKRLRLLEATRWPWPTIGVLAAAAAAAAGVVALYQH
jgi:hypothetical protein